MNSLIGGEIITSSKVNENFAGIANGTDIADESILPRHLANDTWHEVGDPNEPAYQNGWVEYNTTYGGASFRKDVQGFVHLRGLIKNGTLNSTMFTLPVGYRPAKHIIIAVQTNSVGNRLDIRLDGTVRMDSGGSNAWVSLSNAVFQAEL